MSIAKIFAWIYVRIQEQDMRKVVPQCECERGFQVQTMISIYDRTTDMS